MTPPAISVEQLSKRFRIGSAKPSYGTLRDRIAGMFRREVAAPETREVWALRDISLNVAEGEAVGLIGHNGAGKSTLLKILTRITEPTEGQAVLRGRVASLLEVGTGFHPELTGRENIFLNGAILGMTRAEIRQNFDAIVAFSEIEKFLDTPVKRYSSGMYVRLAFAVAAHLTPEILLVDEVLSVGDVEFQRRCLGRMNEVARSGRTVVFVSHNLGSIEDLCSRTVLLSGGRIVKDGPTREVISHYLSRRGSSGSMVDLAAFADREGTGRARITAIELLAADRDEPMDVIEFGASFRVRLHFVAHERLAGPDFGLAVLNERSERIFFSCMRDEGRIAESLTGSGTVDCLVKSPNLLPDLYFLEVWITDEARGDFADHVRMVAQLEVTASASSEMKIGRLTAYDRGMVWIASHWSFEQDEQPELRG